MSKNLKQHLSIIISMILVFSMLVGSCVFAGDGQLETQLDEIYKSVQDRMDKDVFLSIESEYRDLSICAELSGEVVLSSLDEILDKYDGSDIRTYTKSAFRSEIPMEPFLMLDPRQTAEVEWAGGKWYYNTGVSLPQSPSYSATNMLSVVYYGNILVENDATTGGMLGHAAIVEGKYYNTTYNTYYIRLIEAIGYGAGVCRGVVDDSRYLDKAPKFYSVYNANSSTLTNAISFAAGQLGKPYELNFSDHDGSSSNPGWYCSELVWAAYYNAGINLCPNIPWNQAVSPSDLKNSSSTSQIGMIVY